MSLRYADPEEVGMSAERIRHLVDLVRGWVDGGQIPALVVLAARHGKIILHEAFGRMGPEPDAPPLDADAVFPLASISKPITATLAMVLVDDGLLGLNRPVQEYVPEFLGDGKDQVMVHQLLTHTSGLEDADHEAHLKRKGVPGVWSIPEGRYPTRDEWVRGALDLPLTRKPGKEMSYCGLGFEILGEIIQRVSCRSLEDFARERLFGPLGMRGTWYVVPESADHRVVRARTSDNSTWSVRFRRSGVASGSVHSTASDLAAFGQMILGGGALGGVRILSRASVGEMIRNQIPGIGARYFDEYFPEASWGLGWDVEVNKTYIHKPSLISDRAVSHHGGGTSFIWIDPGYDLVGVYLMRLREDYASGKSKWNSDLFADAVTAAIED